MSLEGLPACVSVHHVCVRDLQRPEEESGTPETEVAGSCKSPCGAGN